jgi:KaiC/GvpD/RAD55 family RecA-like ATPase
VARKAGHYANALPGRVLLGARIRDGVESPEYVVQDFLLEGRVHAISAPPGSGKTLIAVGSGLTVIEAGRSVVYVDGENGPGVMAGRLASLGADPDLLDASFYYYPVLLGKNDAQGLRRAVEDLRPALVGGIRQSRRLPHSGRGRG